MVPADLQEVPRRAILLRAVDSLQVVWDVYFHVVADAELRGIRPAGSLDRSKRGADSPGRLVASTS
jgi:hypothetical protein